MRLAARGPPHAIVECFRADEWALAHRQGVRRHSRREIAARSFGINLARYKTIAFAASATLTGPRGASTWSCGRTNGQCAESRR
ncbi:MAG: hypothetical protein AB7O44_32300, partial [Hyphomicrobiaceae bacterium]